MSNQLNILTLATGKKLYVDMAVNLARSFWLWNKDAGIDFYLATDLPHYLPDDVKSYVKVIALQPDELGKGFSPKLHLDKLAPAGQTLFIDSDCLIYGSLKPVFNLFKGYSVAVVGVYVNDGEWFGDVAAICKKNHIKQLPKFNGGIYYLERGDKATQVYETARELETQYDEIGFVRLRGRPNDEVLMALAMALHGQSPVDDNGSILAEFVNFQSGIESDLLKGSVTLYNKPGHPRYQKNWPLKEANPLIVHFLGHHNQTLPYIKEVKRLKYILGDKYPAGKAGALTWLQVTLPANATTLLKQLFRPLYRAVAGTRKVKQSERVIN
ncbi:hypothetical protein [Mucilaginibacter sp. UR6-11]|uniref:hypothetical protein n=1 Tax=Mucilaginibacter sp. UR6-11 TaxID=1435644 RepID=UPI001E3B7A0E|nr:hypothetical protein [Mucilaginibacter sp. UR6-11]MCC8425733.1 hypothetical protein [Mucilaginibacter sp. UR6-11]